MANNNIEIEIQVNVENIKPLISFLRKNAKFQSESHQTDEYFSPHHRNFLNVRPVNEWFRTRDNNGIFSLTYKNWYYDKNGKSESFCDEFETKIDDLESFRKILIALNFKFITKVDKTRKIWIYKDYEIAIDSVVNLGDFVEIEYVGKNKNVNPKAVTAEMISFFKKIRCGKITRNYVGYPFLLLFPKEAKFEVYA